MVSKIHLELFEK